MNYYEHHIGDYAAATSHLSFVEDAAYSRLMRIYYRDEKPLPLELKAVQRLVGARTREEKSAVETVLNEFFTKSTDGWHSKRCDEEIAKVQDKRDKARRSAEARWNPAKPACERIDSDMRTHPSSNANASETHNGRNAHQTPDTRHQTPEEAKAESPDGDSSPGAQPPLTLGEDEEPGDAPGVPPCPVKRIVEAYHRELPMLARVRALPSQAERMLRARWREDRERQNVQWWVEFFAYVRTCPFLVGEKTDFQADLLWLVRPTNFAKVVNGNYEVRSA